MSNRLLLIKIMRDKQISWETMSARLGYPIQLTKLLVRNNNVLRPQIQNRLAQILDLTEEQYNLIFNGNVDIDDIRFTKNVNSEVFKG